MFWMWTPSSIFTGFAEDINFFSSRDTFNFARQSTLPGSTDAHTTIFFGLRDAPEAPPLSAPPMMRKPMHNFWVMLRNNSNGL
jgi:hypothetical protein